MKLLCVAVTAFLLNIVQPSFGDISSCLSFTNSDTCQGQTEEGTGDTCVWCSCAAVPSECLSASLAKKLPAAVFTCDGLDGTDVIENAAVEEDEYEEEPRLSVDRGIDSDMARSLFQSWKVDFGVSYSDIHEEESRLAAFMETLKRLQRHSGTYSAGLNKFADITWEEFQSSRLGFNGLTESQNCSATHRHPGQFRSAVGPFSSPPPSMDWRDAGAVSQVKDQSHCGSCWTFSTTGCLESHHFLRTGEMVLLSEQQLVDCAQAFDNHGCNGGLPSHAFQYAASVGGLDTEEAYPYLGEDSTCHFVPADVGAQVVRSVNITFQDEGELLEAVGNIGPVSIAFQVADNFRDYDGGVYDNPDCGTAPDEVNHAVLAVGYDTTEDGVDYWIVKNSWGEDWGLNGYFHIARGKNMCGLADCASFPQVP